MEAFFEKMERYVRFTEAEGSLLQALAPQIGFFLPRASERFYDLVGQHPDVVRRFSPEVLIAKPSN